MTEDEFVAKFRGGKGAHVSVDADGKEHREKIADGEQFIRMIYRLLCQGSVND